MRRIALVCTLGLVALSLASLVPAKTATAIPATTTGTCSVSGTAVVTVTCTPGAGTWTPPTGVTSAHVKVEGGQGGGAFLDLISYAAGGAGGVVNGTLSVSSANTYNIFVGSAGGRGVLHSSTGTADAGGAGASGGGTAMGGGAGAAAGSGGGGAGSEIDLNTTRLVVAGGGGGGGGLSFNGVSGGNGGAGQAPATGGGDGQGTCGGSGGQPGAAAAGIGGPASTNCTGGTAGTGGQNASAGVGGNGGAGNGNAGGGGGGGGGFFGGGGGAGGGTNGVNPTPTDGGGGGGAGASHVDASVTGVSFSSNSNGCVVGTNCFFSGPERSGRVTIDYEIPTTLSVTKTGPASVRPDTDITYSVTVTNTGSVEAPAVFVTDPLPSGTSYVSASTTTAGWDCSHSGSTAVCASLTLAHPTDDPIAPGASVVFTIVAHVSTTPPTSLSNTASAFGGNAPTATSNTVTTNVEITPTTTLLTSSVNPSTVGQPVTFTAKVCPSSGTTAPLGSVHFVIDGTNFGGPVTSGSAVPTNCTAFTSGSTSTLSGISSPGHTVTATYAPTNGFVPSQDTLGQVVNRVSSSTAVTQSPNPASFGSPVTLTAAVTPSSATGTVQFKNGSTNLGPPVGLNGSAQALLTISTLAPGQTITAVYSGDATYEPSQGQVSPVINVARTLGGGPCVSGNMTIGGGSWLVQNFCITGTLTITAGTSVAIVNSTINNQLTITSPGAVAVCGSKVVGNLSITGATGYVLVGDPRDDGCAANNLRNVSLGSNTKGVELSANTISGNVSFTSNKGGGPFPEDVNPSIEANQITGNLACTSNTPAPTNNTRPNTVGGLRSGQCGAAGF